MHIQPFQNPVVGARALCDGGPFGSHVAPGRGQPDAAAGRGRLHGARRRPLPFGAVLWLLVVRGCLAGTIAICSTVPGPLSSLDCSHGTASWMAKLIEMKFHQEQRCIFRDIE